MYWFYVLLSFFETAYDIFFIAIGPILNMILPFTTDRWFYNVFSYFMFLSFNVFNPFYHESFSNYKSFLLLPEGTLVFKLFDWLLSFQYCFHSFYIFRVLMLFHQNVGSLITLTNQGRTAMRRNPQQDFNNAIVFSADPLFNDTVFEIRIDKRVSYRFW